MATVELNADYIIQDEEALRALFPPTHDLAIKKSLKALDSHAEEFIRRAPFICLGTQGVDGKADVSPRGDPAGFVKILDRQTLVIPDRPGNNRLDSLSNIIANPSVGVLFIVPGFDDTLRVNGRAELTTDPQILDQLKVKDRLPKVAIVIHIDTVFLHCAKAFRRSKLWDPESFQTRSEMPSLVKIILDQTTGAPDDSEEMKKLDEALEHSYKTKLY
ncbi:MAG: pyridoxamine 5'-phosphate oxidase family protein [Thalassovita sp.]